MVRRIQCSKDTCRASVNGQCMANQDSIYIYWVNQPKAEIHVACPFTTLNGLTNQELRRIRKATDQAIEAAKLRMLAREQGITPFELRARKEELAEKWKNGTLSHKI